MTIELKKQLDKDLEAKRYSERLIAANKEAATAILLSIRIQLTRSTSFSSLREVTSND